MKKMINDLSSKTCQYVIQNRTLSRYKSAQTKDSSIVRIGNMSPAFKPSKISQKLKNESKVRIGNMSPAFKPSVKPQALKDEGKVRVGNMSPAFRV
ncbi:MAG: hypothetical protein ABJP65_06830 [Sneathiella sp.]